MNTISELSLFLLNPVPNLSDLRLQCRTHSERTPIDTKRHNHHETRHLLLATAISATTPAGQLQHLRPQPYAVVLFSSWASETEQAKLGGEGCSVIAGVPCVPVWTLGALGTRPGAAGEPRTSKGPVRRLQPLRLREALPRNTLARSRLFQQ